MNTDIQDALSSVTEVAIFAWSLLELLLMRILPLVGFLTCHLLLQFGSLLSSVVTSPAANPSRSRSAGRRPRASTEYSYSWEEVLQAVEEEVVEKADDVHAVKGDRHIWGVPQAEEVAQELQAEEVEKVPVAVKEEDDRQNSSAESLKSTDDDEEHGEISPRTSDEKAPNLLPSIAENEETETAATSAEAALPPSAPPEEQVTDPGNEKPALHSDGMHVAESSPSDVQKNAPPPSEKHADKAKKPAAGGVAEGHVSSKAERSAGIKVDMKPSDTRSARSEEKRKMSGEGGAEMRKSRSSRGSRSILRVLPPSLSQVERTLRQRSRRVSFSQD